MSGTLNADSFRWDDTLCASYRTPRNCTRSILMPKRHPEFERPRRRADRRHLRPLFIAQLYLSDRRSKMRVMSAPTCRRRAFSVAPQVCNFFQQMPTNGDSAHCAYFADESVTLQKSGRLRGVELGLQSSCYLFGGVHAPKRERAMVCGRNLALTIAVLLAPALAVAQAPPATKGPVAPMTEQLDPRACAHSDTPTTMGKASEIDPQQHEAAGNLSDKLARSAGVICPPQHIDPEIRQPTPPGGPMPVIPPPGSPGGDQSVQPK